MGEHATTNDGLGRWLMRAFIAAIGLGLAKHFVGGIEVAGPGTLIAAGVLLGVVNALVRPVVVLLTLPFTLLSLGIFLLVINAAMLGLVAWLLPGLRIASFGVAFQAALVVSVVSWLGGWLIGPRSKIVVQVRR